ncbi:MAG: C4-type zinc ribbon domain-containing protein [Candidatus Omnitrophota bacterium]
MATVSIKEQTGYLIELQTIDTQIYNLNKRLFAIPIELENKNREFEVKKSGLKALEEKNKELLLKKKGEELELAAKEGVITKLQSQLFSIKTNKEYTVMLKEIDGAKADKSLIEDQILGILEALDNIAAEVNKEKNSLTEEEKKLNKDKAGLEIERKTIEEEIAVLNHKRSQAAPKIDRRILATYERILKNKDGLALVKVVNNACQGCFMNVTHQTVNEIRMYDKLVTCQACARILYEENE